MNKRQWKFRVKNMHCWECDISLNKDPMRYGWTCPKCNQFYSQLVLYQYKKAYEKREIC